MKEKFLSKIENILIGGATKLVHCRAVRTGSLMILRLVVDNPRMRQYILGDENVRTSVCEKSGTPPMICGISSVGKSGGLISHVICKSLGSNPRSRIG